MHKGDFILLEYEGRVKQTGEVFAATKEKDKQHPVFAIVGEHMVVPGVDEALLSLSVGEERTVDVPAEKGFGQRRPSMMKILSLSKFRENKIEPIPGDVLEIDGMHVRVLSVTGGRVRVDFNHPLAGRELEYTVKIAQQITDPAEKLKRLIEQSGIPFATAFAAGKATLTGPKLPDQLKEMIEKDLKKRVAEVTTVEFIEKQVEPKAAKLEIETKLETQKIETKTEPKSSESVPA